MFPEFNKTGIFLAKHWANDILGAWQDCSTAWLIAKQGKIPHIRVYEDYPRFLGLNVAGIEDPLFYIPALKRWLAQSRLLSSLLREITGWPGADLELARLHVNGWMRYQGEWHRDDSLDRARESVVAIAYLMDEAGFRIAPATSSASSTYLGDTIQLTGHRLRDDISEQYVLDAKAGDMLFMQAYLLHRGYSTRPRMHLHLRFRRSRNGWDRERWSEWRFNQHEQFNPKSSTRLGRAKNLARYFRPNSSHSSFWK